MPNEFIQPPWVKEAEKSLNDEHYESPKMWHGGDELPFDLWSLSIVDGKYHDQLKFHDHYRSLREARAAALKLNSKGTAVVVYWIEFSEIAFYQA